MGHLYHGSDECHKKVRKEEINHSVHSLLPEKGRYCMLCWLNCTGMPNASSILVCRDPVQGKLVCGQVDEYYINAYTGSFCACACIYAYPCIYMHRVILYSTNTALKKELFFLFHGHSNFHPCWQSHVLKYSKMCYIWSYFCKKTLKVIKIISKLFFDFVIRCSLCVRKSLFRITADLMES